MHFMEISDNINYVYFNVCIKYAQATNSYIKIRKQGSIFYLPEKYGCDRLWHVLFDSDIVYFYIFIECGSMNIHLLYVRKFYDF